MWNLWVEKNQKKITRINRKYKIKKFDLSVGWSLRSRITGSRLKLNFWVQHINYSGKKTWSIFGANLLHPNFYLSNITGWPFRLRLSCKTKLLFVAAAFRIKYLLFAFLILIFPYVWTQEFLIKFTF